MSKSNVLIGCTGSVATIKVPELITALLENDNFDVKLVATDKALNFLPECEEVEILTDNTEWKSWKRRGDPILHIDLRRWADILVIAPLDANTMAKMAQVNRKLAK